MEERDAVYCSECEMEIREDEIKHYEDGETYCAECYAERIYCANCNEFIESGDEMRDDDGEAYCESCFQDMFFTCDRCESVTPNEELYATASDEYICDDCYCNHYATCYHCDEIYEIHSITRIADLDRYVCEDCLSENYYFCDSCSAVILPDDSHYVESTDMTYCNECYRENVSRNVHNYSYIPEDLSFNKLQYENTLFLGLELEVENYSNHSTSEIADEFNEYLADLGIQNKIYLKEDGSLEDGFEICSHPFTLKYAHKNLQFKKILEWLQDVDMRSYKGGNCGIHVHLDRKFFNCQFDEVKLRMFFSVCANQLRVFGNRHGQNESYCRYEDWNRDQFLKAELPDGRYQAINFNSHHGTIELRLFRGTLHYGRFIATLQFADAIAYWIKQVGISYLITAGNGNIWKSFTEYLKQSGQYAQLIKHLEKKELI